MRSVSGAIVGTIAPRPADGKDQIGDAPALIGTDSCDPALGYSLPPGKYDIIVSVTITYSQTPGVRPANQLTGFIRTTRRFPDFAPVNPAVVAGSAT